VRIVYQYDPSNLSQPIKTFDGLRQAARSLNNPLYHDYHIRNASVNNTLLEGYRWLCTDEDVQPPTEIPPTKEEPRIQRNNGPIAQINKEKTQILNVFATQKDAEQETKIHNSQISIGLSSGLLRSGFFWIPYEDCDESLKQTYHGIIPEPKRIATCSKVVQQIDPFTNNVVETYQCMQDVCSKFKCCHKSINKASASGNIFKGFKWNVTNNSP
jgi:hypothetical protein